MDLLKASVDKIVVLVTDRGEHLAQILFVYEGEDTPDVFYLEMEPRPDGSLQPKGPGGYSTLLADIVSVRLFDPEP